MRRLRHAIGLACLGLLAIGCSGADERTIVIDRAELSLSGSDVSPSGPWESVSLPDRWDLMRRRQATDGWYRARFDHPAPGVPIALWLPRVYPNAEAFVNGERVGSGGRVDPPPARNRYRPVLLPIRDGLVRTEDNELWLRFVGTPGSVGTLHPIWIGEQDALRALHDRWSFLGVSLGQVAIVLAVLLAAVAAQQAAGPDRVPGAGWYAGGLLAIAGSSVGLFTADVALPSRFVVVFVAICVHFAVLSFAIGVARGLGTPTASERFWIGGYGAAALLTAAVPPLYVPAVFVLWWVPSLLLLGRMAWRLWELAVRRNRRGFAAGLAATFAAIVTVGSSAAAARRAELPADLGGVVLPWMLVVIFGGLILGQLRGALQEARRANRELEARVAARERELAERYEALRSLEDDRARAQERQRISRDMHDGTGGQLASALARLRTGRATPEELERSLEDALLDLRLTLGSVHADAVDLPGLLGLLRERIGREAEQHAMRLAWEVGDAGEDRPLPAEAVLHVIRFVQEAVGNAVRHSQGRTLRVGSTWSAASAGAARLEVYVQDDGRGGASARPGGHGLTNFEERARLLGGELDLTSDASGTSVRLRFDPPGVDSLVASDDAEL